MIQRLQTILGHFQWENGHNSLQQSWITIKNATFDISKKFLGPVHLHPKTDKWDYFRSPIMKKKIVSCFDIREVPRSPGKWNWNWLYFLPFIFTFEQGDIHLNCNGAAEVLQLISNMQYKCKQLLAIKVQLAL